MLGDLELRTFKQELHVSRARSLRQKRKVTPPQFQISPVRPVIRAGNYQISKSISLPFFPLLLLSPVYSIGNSNTKFVQQHERNSYNHLAHPVWRRRNNCRNNKDSHVCIFTI